MRNIKGVFFILMFCSIQLMSVFFAQQAHAFSCTSNGIRIDGTGTFTIPVNVSLTKSTTQLTLTDMSAYTSCTGDWGYEYQDALKVTAATLSTSLTSIGYTGYLTTSGIKYSFPSSGACIWPDSNCTILSTQNIPQTAAPVRVVLGMERQSMISGQGATIPAGTEIARLTVQQRSRGSWGWNKTWIFTTNTTIYIPAYTCQLNNPTQTVTFPPVNAKDIRNNGAGSFPGRQNFKMNLTCDPHTTVSMRFDGPTMQGHADVLSNTSSSNEAIGIQIFYKNVPLTMGAVSQVIADSQTQETLSFDAGYYYNGNEVRAGSVRAVATVTFSYN